MSSIYGDSCPGETIIYKRHSLFKQSRESIEEDHRSTSDNIEKVEKLLLKMLA